MTESQIIYDGPIVKRPDAKARGLKRYFTGKHCPKGHVCERYVSTHQCVKCCSINSISKTKGVKRHFVTENHILEVAFSCRDFNEFRTSFPNDYNIASKRGLIRKIQSKIGRGVTTSKWCEVSCVNEARKYNTRSEFSKCSSGAYSFALSNCILDDCCAHMERSLTDADTVYVWGHAKDDKYICKVGITSKRLGFERINSVQRKSGIICDFVLYIETERARSIEREILSLGRDVDLAEFNGSTEFREFSPEEFKFIEEMQEWNKDRKNGSKREKGV